MAGRPIEDGIVVVKDGKIVTIGKASDVKVPTVFARSRPPSSRPA